MELKTISFNCHGLKTSLVDIRNLCESYDVVFLQELWLNRDELCTLHKIHPDYDAFGVSGMDDATANQSGRPYGGVGILVHKRIRPKSQLKTHDERIVSLHIDYGNDSLYFINVYMPYQCDDNNDKFMECIGKIEAIIEAAPSTKIIVVGDFNANVNTNFEHELLEMCKRSQLVVSDFQWFGKHSECFTYVSDAHMTTSWLDHYICSCDAHALISDIHILDKLPCSDHLPIAACFQIEDATPTQGHPAAQLSRTPAHPVSNWSKATQSEIDNYTQCTRLHLNNLKLPLAVFCNDVNCKCSEHKEQLNDLYSDIVCALRKSSEDCIPSCKRSEARDYIIPGFNDYVRELHTAARQSYLIWRNCGKPRSGPWCESMRHTRLAFKYALRQCKILEETHRADAMAKSLDNGDINSFWKKVKTTHNKSVPLPVKVNEAVGSDDIANMWQKHFHSILNSVNNNTSEADVNRWISDNRDTYCLTIQPNEIAESLKSLKRGKSSGVDGLAAEHLIFSHETLHVHLSILFTSFCSHGYLPNDFMKSAIVPILKDKSGDSSDVNNYRPIALVTSCSKLFEIVIGTVIGNNLLTCDNQFGFKREHSTDLCIFTVKNVIEFYRNNSSPVYTCFLDASKAFDRVNHWELFKKLMKRNVPYAIVRILMFWYQTQTLCIKWGESTSCYFGVKNGVRQGGILSPQLFNVYVDDLSNMLLNCSSGCFIGNKCINHVFYADDLCLMAPSPSGLQKLIDVCYNNSVEIDVLFNPKKSVCMVFKPKNYKLSCPRMKLNDNFLQYVSAFKYLGYHFNENFKDDDEILHQIRTFYARLNSLLRDFAHCSISIKLKLLKTYCINFYCSYIWSDMKSRTLQKMRVAYNNAHRKILGFTTRDSVRGVLTKNNIDTFDIYLRKTTFSFRERVCISTNEVVDSLIKCWSILDASIWKQWSKILYTH